MQQKSLPCNQLILLNSAPVQRGRYMWVRCRPDARSSNCKEEQGPPFIITDGNANMALPPMADPKFQDHPETFLLPDNEYGSGNDMDSESGSGFEFNELITPDFVVNQPGPDLKLKLTNEHLFLPENRL
uniref:Uncharacterized protein n=1 Tax=Salvator merianae TaxID=96440 RepID=A0A8D0BQ69_SALMN